MHTVDYEKQILCMKILIDLYHNAMLQNEDLHDVFLYKRIEAMQVIQFDLMYKIKDYRRAVSQLNEWEAAGIYPYKIPKIKKEKRKKAKSSLKARVFDLMKNHFGSKSAYLLLCKILCKENKNSQI